MRALKDAEASVLRTLLGARPTTERSLIESSGLSRSTFQYARRRCYAHGWIYDRYVPDVRLVEPLRLEVELRWPFAGARNTLIQARAQDPSTVLLWSLANLVLSVRFVRPGAPVSKGPDSANPNDADRSVTVRSGASASEVPVYFDCSGALSRLFGESPGPGYPRILGTGSDTEEPVAPIPPSRRRAAAELVGAAQRTVDSSFFGRRTPPFPLTLPRDQVRLVTDGYVRWNVFPRLGGLPPYRGRSVRDLLFVYGTLGGSDSGARLFESVAADAGAYPILVAVGSEEPRTTVLVFLGEGLAHGGRSGPRRERSLQSLLQERLDPFTIVREPLASLNEVVEHRYLGLLEPTPAPS